MYIENLCKDIKGIGLNKFNGVELNIAKFLFTIKNKHIDKFVESLLQDVSERNNKIDIIIKSREQ